MEIKLRKLYKRQDNSYAFLGEFERSPVVDDPIRYIKRFYVDCRNSKGFSCNDNDVPCNVSISKAKEWLKNNEYKEVGNVYYNGRNNITIENIDEMSGITIDITDLVNL
ncbi:MAG: hypothetical protein IJ172_10025 [Ruminococcus sp.]|nr:hypothetical protein [Ruminococcus sp.]